MSGEARTGPAQTVRVLLVEDDARVARVNRDLLERDADVHVVGSAGTCTQGHALVAALHPDLILLDVHLPDGSGLDLLRHWRAQGMTLDVAVITAADDETSIRQALAHGAFDYLIKPFTAARLAELLTRHRARRELTANVRHAQASLDRLLGVTPGSAEPLPRGIDPHTLERVAASLDAGAQALSAEEVGERVGLSRVTAWRYLEHLVKTGQAALEHQYGLAGRPTKLYRAAPPDGSSGRLSSSP